MFSARLVAVGFGRKSNRSNDFSDDAILDAALDRSVVFEDSEEADVGRPNLGLSTGAASDCG